MGVMIVTDIFGLSESSDELVLFLNRFVSDVCVVEPYAGIRHDFKNEHEAYDKFVEKCGHENYFSLLKQRILETDPKFIVGFSAGANAVWRLSDLAIGSCEKLFCFYPSQIFNHLYVMPKTLIEVIFPKEEASFDVNGINKEILLKPNTHSQVTSYGHGFMNKSSKAYDLEGTRFFLAHIKGCLGSDNCR